jgi:hypothetical protein
MRAQRLLTVLLCISLLASCANLLEPPLATPLPTEFVPTAIAMTLQAKNAGKITPAAQNPEATGAATTMTVEPASSAEPGLTSTATLPQPSDTPTVLPATESPSETPPEATPEIAATLPNSVTPAVLITATATPFPEIPDARVQIYKLGDLSKIISPLVVTSRLTSRVGKVVRFDLYGEDGRLLARQLKVFYDLPWHVATLTMSLDFEISAAAELGRLVVSVEDVYGRIVDVNSVNLLLLSTGVTELNPASALLESIVVQEPEAMTLLIGGKVLVTGIAKPFTDQPLNVLLIAEDGRVLGERLAGVTILTPGGYGTFFAEVSYSVTETTRALLVVYESGNPISQYAHLTSREVILAP